MISNEMLKHIRQLEIQTKRLLRSSLAGQSSSAVKGSGFEFDQIREYQQGDDVRFIDWKSSARAGRFMVRQYIEERRRTIMLLVDVSGSAYFGSQFDNKHHMMSEIAAIIALAADICKDRVGLLLFTDEVELFIPPGSGQHHVRSLIERLFTYRPVHKATSISRALAYLAQLRLKDAVVFLISDFIGSSPFEKAFAVVAKKYELIAIRTLDKNERHLPNVGLLTLVDVETGQELMVDVRSRTAPFNNFCRERIHDRNKLFSRYGVDLFETTPGQFFIANLIRFFRQRMLY